MYDNPQLIIETANIEPGKIAWRSPSNLALVKYWGKYGQQLPKNPSISFTLEHACTDTYLEYRPKRGVDEGIALEFFFKDEPNEPFRIKLVQFLEKMTSIFPFLKQLEFTIRSSNSFPHSAGIASSASSMSALALCLCSLEDRFFGTLKDDTAFRQKASYVARLGSGSASRSIFDGFGLWGETPIVEGSSNLYAIPYKHEVDPIFHTFHDDILIASKGEKSVSSTAGHALMENNIYAENRYRQANQHMQQLLSALKTGDLEAFGRITESEALVLHALMMTSHPPYILMRPATLSMIEALWTFRKETKLPVYFSLDAGPNIHLLYPNNIKPQVDAFVQSELIPLCENGEYIADKVGSGPLEL